MKYVYNFFCFAFAALIIVGCGNNSKPSYEIGCKVEKVFFKNDSVSMGSLGSDTLWDDETNCYYVKTEQVFGVMNSRYEIFSPEHNLLMVMGKSSECFIAQGFKFSYDSIGRTTCVTYVQIDQDELEGTNEDTTMFKEMLRLYGNNDSAWIKYEIKRDGRGHLVRIGDLNCLDYSACEYGVYDGHNFWFSDIDGGDIHFVVIMHEGEHSDKPKSTFDLYYVDGKLAVETLCWNGKPVRSIVYHHNGRFAAIYGNENAPLDIALCDYCLESFNGKSIYILK